MAWSWIASLISPQEDNAGVAIISNMSVAGVVLLIITAAVTEELVYRGYLQERLGSLLRSRWIGAAVSLAIFIAPHIVFFGPTWLFHQLVGSLALVAFTLIRRNLVATMLLHLLVNAPILIPTVLAKL